MKRHAPRASDHIYRLFSHTQVRQYVGACTNLVARALKVLNNGFAGTAQTPCKKRLGYCDVGNAIGWFVEPVPFVRINDLGHWNIFGLHRGNNRIAFRHLATHIIGAVKKSASAFCCSRPC
jgi:hypothetical protein